MPSIICLVNNGLLQTCIQVRLFWRTDANTSALVRGTVPFCYSDACSSHSTSRCQPLVLPPRTADQPSEHWTVSQSQTGEETREQSLQTHTPEHLPGDMERLSAALSIAGHAGSAGGLALPPLVLTDVTCLVKQQRGGQRSQKIFVIWK